ncbi:MAG: hypothetical protein HC858_06610 [Brachymonas sp.]|nr:hypothetical protein [Brachymonas sp.]
MPTPALRGGSWNNTTDNARASIRNRNQPDNWNNNVGFRVVLSIASRSAVGKAFAYEQRAVWRMKLARCWPARSLRITDDAKLGQIAR